MPEPSCATLDKPKCSSYPMEITIYDWSIANMIATARFRDLRPAPQPRAWRLSGSCWATNEGGEMVPQRRSGKSPGYPRSTVPLHTVKSRHEKDFGGTALNILPAMTGSTTKRVKFWGRCSHLRKAVCIIGAASGPFSYHCMLIQSKSLVHKRAPIVMTLTSDEELPGSMCNQCRKGSQSDCTTGLPPRIQASECAKGEPPHHLSADQPQGSSEVQNTTFRAPSSGGNRRSGGTGEPCRSQSWRMELPGRRRCGELQSDAIPHIRFMILWIANIFPPGENTA